MVNEILKILQFLIRAWNEVAVDYFKVLRSVGVTILLIVHATAETILCDDTVD
jgi:hypothetical protein